VAKIRVALRPQQVEAIHLLAERQGISVTRWVWNAIEDELDRQQKGGDDNGSGTDREALG
jgi:hypothetical protein